MNGDDMEYKDAVQLISSTTDESKEVVLTMKGAFEGSVNESSFDYQKAVEQIEGRTQQRFRADEQRARSSQQARPGKAAAQASTVEDLSKIAKQTIPNFVNTPIPGAASLFHHAGEEQYKKQQAPSAPAQPAPEPRRQKVTLPQENIKSIPEHAQSLAQIQQPVKPRQDTGAKAAGEISRMVSGLGGAFSKEFGELGKAVKKPAPSKALIVTFSLQDQISDLEKIVEGLDERVFDAKQIAVIRFEVSELNKSISGSSKPEGEEAQLVQLRDSRLKEVIKKLSGYNT